MTHVAVVRTPRGRGLRSKAAKKRKRFIQTHNPKPSLT